MNQRYGVPSDDAFECGPHGGGGGFGFRSRREAREMLREHGAGRHGGPFGGGQVGFNPTAFMAGGFGPGGFGPGGGGFGPGFGFGFGPGGGGRGPRGHRRGGRGRRGDVRAAILALLAERPMHGYEMIQEIGERSNGLWRPSPGSVYPTLQLLVDEGLIKATESEGSKKLFDLTETGRETADKLSTPPWEEIAEGVDPGHVNLRTAVGQLMGAVAQVAVTATPEQQERITEVVNNARREIYNILGEAE